MSSMDKPEFCRPIAVDDLERGGNDFEISAEHMLELDGWDEGLRTSWDPSGVP